MNRLLFTLVSIGVLFAFSHQNGITADGETSTNQASRQNVDLTINLPSCKRDLQAWRKFSPITSWWDRHRKGWRDDAEMRAQYNKEVKEDRLQWLKEDAIDIAWMDIDGDGWCDAITSGAKEPYGHGQGKPVLLLEPRAIYMRTTNGFKPFKDGMITSEYEGSSFTIYWDKVSKSAVIYKRTYQGNLVGGGDGAGDEFHVRQMLHAAFVAKKAGNVDEETAYYNEADPFLYTGQLPEASAERIWDEEAHRVGMNIGFRAMY